MLLLLLKVVNRQSYIRWERSVYLCYISPIDISGSVDQRHDRSWVSLMWKVHRQRIHLIISYLILMNSYFRMYWATNLPSVVQRDQISPRNVSRMYLFCNETLIFTGFRNWTVNLATAALPWGLLQESSNIILCKIKYEGFISFTLKQMNVRGQESSGLLAPSDTDTWWCLYSLCNSH